MIIKELDQFTAEDKFAKAGRVAEEQMAHYLNRAFKNDESVRVFNGIRLKKEQDAAQIDHLILSQHGIIIIESKSVTSEVYINPHGEWSRQFDGKLKGMPSPILQAKRQGEFLREYLNDYTELCFRKILGFQLTFEAMPIDLIVAISDNGIVHRPDGIALEEVCKAEQACDRIRTILEKYRKANSLLGFNFSLNTRETGCQFSEGALSRLSHLLLEQHKPSRMSPSQQEENQPVLASTSKSKSVVVAKSQPTKVDKPAAKPQPVKATKIQTGKYICRHCQRNELSISSGKFGYYFKCSQCEGNTPIQSVCQACHTKQRIRKSGLQFFAECDRCNTSGLFYTNPSV
ncbi:NERD domain-containing protein [Leptolyngbya sp. FACHB-541]|uniref:nuclease-related domain-containing protein n=1 Tax=Leptolyngbya sp. FACHB-541 TaxID=2692810 RepID=UPI00168929D5|nr:nuclease-related domain-containing protein [Leptolyngbya sp. FACHB-541]MBD1999038.1 NERD domain-containing protein [Leptolyngbya sp. FACHB-541]